MKQTREILLFSVLTFALLVTGKADASCNGNNPPTITSINPSTGFVSGGTVVTISGGSLGCVSVTFGGVSATNVTATGTTVTATSPAGAAGTVDLIVTNPNRGANANATATTQFSYITTASVPTSLVATVGDRQVSVAFTAPTSTGGSSIINYEYQLDGGSWVSANTTSSPVVITGLTNGTSYSIKLRAVNSAGNGAESAAQSSTPAATSNAPTALVATPGDGQVSIAFTAPTATGGAAITDYEYQLDGGSWVSASTTSGPVVISSLTNGTSYSIKLRAVNSAGNGAESVAVSVDTPSPESAFAEHEADIRNTLVGDASRSLRSSVSANQRMTQSARSRFISARQTKAREEDVTRALIPFDVDGNFTLSESGLSTAGNFFQQVGNEEGTYRRLFFGDFDVQHDNDTDSTTATLTGRMAWEQMTSEQTMLGYFVGGELATSTIGGSFEGDQDRIGVTAGGYVVHELSEQVYFDGFASLGAGRNNLEMANDTLALESEYTTQTATLGGAITGVYSQKGYDFKPELALSFGKTWLGDIGFTGRAYGLVDNTLSLDAGYVSIASFTFRPEVIIPIGADFVADTNTQLSFAPRLVCEQIKSTTKTSDCGTGGELGFSSTSEDGLSSADMRVLLDRINARRNAGLHPSWLGSSGRFSYRP